MPPHGNPDLVVVIVSEVPQRPASLLLHLRDGGMILHRVEEGFDARLGIQAGRVPGREPGRSAWRQRRPRACILDGLRRT